MTILDPTELQLWEIPQVEENGRPPNAEKTITGFCCDIDLSNAC